jgi:hypothetical protein
MHVKTIYKLLANKGRARSCTPVEFTYFTNLNAFMVPFKTEYHSVPEVKGCVFQAIKEFYQIC